MFSALSQAINQVGLFTTIELKGKPGDPADDATQTLGKQLAKPFKASIQPWTGRPESLADVKLEEGQYIGYLPYAALCDQRFRATLEAKGFYLIQCGTRYEAISKPVQVAGKDDPWQLVLEIQR